MKIKITWLGVFDSAVGAIFWGPYGAAIGYGIGQTVRFDGDRWQSLFGGEFGTTLGPRGRR